MENPTTYFPTIKVQWDVTASHTFKTDVLESFNGREQRRVNYASFRRLYSFTTAALDSSGRETLRDFVRARKGRAEAFYFFRPDSDDFSAYNCGTVQGAASFVIPFRTGEIPSTVTQVWIDGSLQGGWSVSIGVGPGGENRINFAGNRTGVVTADVSTAQERMVVRFESDEIAQSWVAPSVPPMAVYRIALRELI
jgi:hypothetical protein